MVPKSLDVKPLEVLIVGGGLGGLSCAIGCLRKGLKVTVLERDATLSEFGAGIQLPPNAARVMHSYGLLGTLIEKGRAFCPGYIYQHRWDGELLTKKPLQLRHWLDFDQYSIHRCDYLAILAAEAQRLGVCLRLNSQVMDVDCAVRRPSVTLHSGEVVEADVIVGADGLFSVMREAVIQRPIEPKETGDLAWRATITRSQIEASGDERLMELSAKQRPMGWLGPGTHVAYYSLRGGSEYNLIIARPDDLPAKTVRQEGDVATLRAFFAGWDPLLDKILSQVAAVQKWKLLHLEPLQTWVRGAVALMGDSCHPTLPYQAQGAAMALEDGATIAEFLSSLAQYRAVDACKGSLTAIEEDIQHVLRLYQQLRKERTELNVRGAESNRVFLHLPLGSEQDERDQMLRQWDWEDLNASSKWPFLDPTYAKELMGFDAEQEARKAFATAFGP